MDICSDRISRGRHIERIHYIIDMKRVRHHPRTGQPRKADRTDHKRSCSSCAREMWEALTLGERVNKLTVDT